eukprot:13072187-Heterocapsa_arctica.AAC.1
MVGDWNQTRIRPAACMDSHHIELLEAAFLGSSFHLGLNVYEVLYGNRETRTGEQAEAMYRHGLLQAFKELNVESNIPFTIV